MDHVIEPAKRVTVARKVDVVVAGAGISGVFAALAAAKRGARTVLVDRFGALGGNIGPGMLIGGPLYEEVTWTLHGGILPGIPGQFVERVDALVRGMPRNYPALSHAVSRVAAQMMSEAGVEVILSAYAADPVMDGRRARGLFIETKSGRIAVLAKVVVDATGDADVARRAGAPFIRGSTAAECNSPNVGAMYSEPQYKTWNDGGIFFLLTGADIEKFQAWGREPHRCTPEEVEWSRRNLGAPLFSWPARAIPILHAGWKSGEFKVWRELRKDVHVLFNNWFTALSPEISGGRAQLFGDYDTGDWEDVTLTEREVRAQAYDGVAFFRKHVPGFEKASILCMSPFLGARGGPCIEGEHVLTPQESYAGLRAPDTMWVSFVETHRHANREGHDMPYGMLLPKKVDGLLVSGRGASFLRRGHDPSTRARCNMMSLGQAVGTAAAMAAKEGVEPRALNVRKLQQALLAEGYYLGDAARLKQLGLKGRAPKRAK